MTSEFPQITSDFLKDLEANNNREWFVDNRGRYEKSWLQPATQFVSALSEAMSKLDPPHIAEPKINGSIRRLHRDTRFSKDKTPFDPKLHLVFWTGDHPNRSPAIHLVLHPDRCGLGAGQFALTKDELERYRFVVSQNSEAVVELFSILKDLNKSGCVLAEESLKSVPRGFDVSEPHETLLKRKGLVAKTTDAGLPPETLCNTARMGAFLQAAARLNSWLVSHVH